MTLVITILASDNARNRRRAKRAALREAKNTVTGCVDRVLKAVSAPSIRSKQEFVQLEIKQHNKVRNEFGQHVNARQKMRGCSIPLI